MKRFLRAFRITAILGFLLGAAVGRLNWSPAWPSLNLLAVCRSAAIGWVIGVVAAAPLAWRWRRAASGAAPRWWRRAAVWMATAVALAPIALWVTYFTPNGLLGKALATGRRAGDERPNLIFITIDALRADHVGAYGSDRGLTPNLDAFAREATRYDNAIVNSPWTLTSFGSLLTGRLPSELGLKAPMAQGQQWYERVAMLPPSVPLLPEQLQQAGYATAAEVTNPFLQAGRGFGRGFDDFRNETVAGGFAPDLTRADRVTKRSVEWLTGNRRAPFFFWVHYLDTHVPYDAPTTPAGVRAKYPAGWKADRNNWYGSMEYAAEPERGRYQQFVKDMYAEEVRFADQRVGELLAALRASGEWDRSLIIITADHGEELFDHGRFDHGHSMHDEVLRVPLLVKWPKGTNAPRVIEQTVEYRDLYSTFLRLGRVPGAPGVGLPLQEEGRGGEVYSESALYGDEQSALTTDDYKVIYHPHALPGEAEFEVYDRRKDPGEHHNLAGSGAAGDLVARLKQMTAQAEKKAAQVREESKFRLSKEAQRGLRSLGYMGK